VSIRLIKTAILTTIVVAAGASSAAIAAPAKTAPAARRPASAQGRTASGNTITAAQGNGALNSAYDSYLNGLRQRMDKEWYLVDGNNHVSLTMTVATDGSVTELDINSSPKNTQAEQAASDAFNKVQPLPSLPSGSGNVRMTLSFDSKASQHDNERHLSGRIDSMPTAGQGNSSTSTQSSSSASSSNESSSTTESSSSSSSSEAGASSNSGDSASTTTGSSAQTEQAK
jgi:TonB family protein